MRPIVFDVPTTVPTAPSLSATSSSGVTLTWTDPTPFNYATGLPASTLGNPMNEIGFRIMRGTGTGGALTQIGTALANQTTFTDTTAVAGTTYRYQVVVYNAAGSRPSNTRTVTVASAPAPTSFRATLSQLLVTLTWVDNDTLESGFVVERSVNGGAFAQFANVPPFTGTGTVTITDSTVTANTYAYRVKTMRGTASSAYAGPVTVVVPAPTAPSGLTVAPGDQHAGHSDLDR